MPKKPLAEKYRPRRLDEILDQEHIKPIVRNFIRRGDIPHMLFIGPAGTGKTTMAHVIANELGWAIVELNASDERGINVVREDIKHLAFSRGKKIILLDEADNMTEDAQQALRRIMEKSIDTRFILTGNFEWKIIDPIKSRCTILRFKPLPRDLMIKRLAEIIVAEGVAIETEEQLNLLKEALAIIVDVSEGDMRKALNLLESVLASGREITPDYVRSLIRPGIMYEAVNCVRNGDLDTAIVLLENALVEASLDVDRVTRELYKAILRLDNERAKVKGLLELARAEHAIKMGGSPVIQLSGVLASIWLHVLGDKQ